MSIKDIRLLEAVTKLVEAGAIVEQDIGDCELSKQIKECASTLSTIVRIKEWVK